MRNRWVALIVGVALTGALQAGVAYDGYILSTTWPTAIRMESEEVHIYWGELCRVSAKFVLQNDANRPFVQIVGLPILQSPPELGVYDLRVSIEEGGVHRSLMQPAGESDFIEGPWTDWTHWKQTFPPGRTVIQIEYHIEAIPSEYDSKWLVIRYIRHSGDNWAGTIGQADVTVHFQVPLGKEQVQRCTPAGFQIEGDAIHWHRTNFKPTERDDIRITYMPFAVYRQLQELRRETEAPAVRQWAELAVVRLARLCFSLERREGYAGDWGAYLPIAHRQYESILTNLRDPNDRAFFLEYWDPNTQEADWDGGLNQVHWPRGNPETVGHRIKYIMNDGGYLPWPLGEFDRQGKEMIERLLEKNPKNADAWLAYIANCHHWIDASAFPGGIMVRWCPLAPKQKEIIARAYAQCPTNEGIKAWHDFATSRANRDCPY